MKKFFLFYAVIGYLFASSSVVAMEEEESEHYAVIHQQTIGNPDIIPYILAVLDIPDLTIASRVCHVWEKCAPPEYEKRFQANKEEVLAFFEGRSYCERLIPTISGIVVTDPCAAMSLSTLHNTLTQHEEDLYHLQKIANII